MPSHNVIDQLVYQVHFGTEVEQIAAHQRLLDLAAQQGIYPASIYPIYHARGAEELAPDFTVPAMNLRGLSYLMVQAALEAAQELKVGLLIFELARSEMRYTGQDPRQVVASVIGAALRVGWKGPVFIQGDHYQPKAVHPGVIKAGERDSIIQLIHDSVRAGIRNIDIDGSTLVDSDQPTEYDQQRPNFMFTADMIHLIRRLQPKTEPLINIGCEISEVGTHLSKSSQLSAFMTGLQDEGGIHSNDWPAKVAIETGTAHGGKVMHDGSAGPMFVDFERLHTISMIARHKYGMAGAVQHGASTLDKKFLAEFPKNETAEIHLSTGFQDLIMAHPAFPQALLDMMYTWCTINCKAERKPDWSDAQFYVKTRKKAWGAFKKQTWNLPEENLMAIKDSLRQECAMYYEGLKVSDTMPYIKKFYRE